MKTRAITPASVPTAAALYSPAILAEGSQLLFISGQGKDERFDNLAGRLAHQDEIESMLSEWTHARPPRAVMDALLSEGVPAGVVQRSSDLQQDPQLNHRGFFRNLGFHI